MTATATHLRRIGRRDRSDRSPDRRGLRRTPRAASRRWVRPLVLAVFAVSTLAVLAAYVFPTRTWLDQRRALAETSAQLDGLRAERRALESRLDLLERDVVIERIARSEYGLVKPGEEAYAVLPPPEGAATLPDVWPFGPLLQGDGRPVAADDEAAGPAPPVSTTTSTVPTTTAPATTAPTTTTTTVPEEAGVPETVPR